VVNATELLRSHNQKLDQATSKTSKITDDLENAAAAARSWSENISVGGAVPGWAIKMISIFGSLAVGNLGGPPTLTRNVALLAAGKLYFLIVQNRRELISDRNTYRRGCCPSS
jgi:hypothetical protein